MYVYLYVYVYVYVYLYMYILSSTFKAGLGSRLIFFRLRLLIFFFKRLRLLVFFQAAQAPAPHFFQAAPAPRGQNMRLLSAPAFRSRYRSGSGSSFCFFGAAPAPTLGFFFQSAPAPRIQKHPAPAPQPCFKDTNHWRWQRWKSNFVEIYLKIFFHYARKQRS